MKKLAALLVVIAGLSGAQVARGDGLIYRLPDDGTSVLYELEIKHGPAGMQRDAKGTLKISSVGTEMVGDDKCRWIEIRIAFDDNGQERQILSKSLIPEKHLGKGKSPGENLVRSWLKLPEQEVMELKDFKQPQAGPLAAFLAGPAAAPIKLDPTTIDNAKLGKLECAGETCTYELEQGGNTVETTFEHRLSDKAPFGVLATKLKFATKNGGNVVDAGEATFTLVDVGTSALTELPNNK